MCGISWYPLLFSAAGVLNRSTQYPRGVEPSSYHALTTSKGSIEVTDIEASIKSIQAFKICFLTWVSFCEEYRRADLGQLCTCLYTYLHITWSESSNGARRLAHDELASLFLTAYVSIVERSLCCLGYPGLRLPCEVMILTTFSSSYGEGRSTPRYVLLEWLWSSSNLHIL